MKNSKANRAAIPMSLSACCLFSIANLLTLSAALPATPPTTPVSLTIPLNLTSPNNTRIYQPSRLALLDPWPLPPFDIILTSPSPLQPDCYLSIAILSPFPVPNPDTTSLLEILSDQTEIYKGREKEHPALGFDIVKNNVRFKMQPVPWHPLDGYLALEALEEIYMLVLEGGAREVTAAVSCRGMAMGRLRIMFIHPPEPPDPYDPDSDDPDDDID